jgi:hypothetical protein
MMKKLMTAPRIATILAVAILLGGLSAESIHARASKRNSLVKMPQM